jgi:hypothetical protein
MRPGLPEAYKRVWVSECSDGNEEGDKGVKERRRNERIAIFIIKIRIGYLIGGNTGTEGMGRSSQHIKTRKHEESEANMKTDKNKKAKIEKQGRSLRNKSKRKRARLQGNS